MPKTSRIEKIGHMVKTTKKIIETGGTKLVKYSYRTGMHAREDLTDEYSLTQAVTKYAERATQAEQRKAQMEAKFEEKIAMMFMHKPTQLT